MTGLCEEKDAGSGKAFGDLIRKYRLRKGISQERLGALVHVKKNAVGAWESGRSRPDLSSIPVLCRELEIPLHVFFGLADHDENYHLNERFDRLNTYNRQIVLHQMDMLYELQKQQASAPKHELVQLFQNDLSAAAGPFSYLGESGGEKVYLISDEMTRRADEIIRVCGDSMEPTFRDGDFVLLQHASHLKEGEIGIFVNSDAGYIKEYRKDGLYSHNPKYGPIRFTEEDSVRCVGRVLGVLQPSQRASAEDIARETEMRL